MRKNTGPSEVVILEDKTAEISVPQARKLFASVDTSHVVGLRDRAVLGVLAYTGARVVAVAKLRMSDYYDLAETNRCTSARRAA